MVKFLKVQRQQPRRCGHRPSINVLIDIGLGGTGNAFQRCRPFTVGDEMVETLKANRPVFDVQAGKVVILLTGRYAGKKAVIVKHYDDGTSSRPYGHALVCGLSTEPRKVRHASDWKPVQRVATAGHATANKNNALIALKYEALGELATNVHRCRVRRIVGCR
jgi:ribosomal protein L14E/L6E/L27E